MAIEIITKVIELGVLVLTGLIGKYLIPLLKRKKYERKDGNDKSFTKTVGF